MHLCVLYFSYACSITLDGLDSVDWWFSGYQATKDGVPTEWHWYNGLGLELSMINLISYKNFIPGLSKIDKFCQMRFSSCMTVHYYILLKCVLHLEKIITWSAIMGNENVIKNEYPEVDGIPAKFHGGQCLPSAYLELKWGVQFCIS